MTKKILSIVLLFSNLIIISQNVIWETEFDFIKSNSSPRSVDLNGDNIEDIVFSGGVDGVPSPFGGIAIDGENGETLWTVQNGNEWFLSTQYFDYNGDQIADLIFGGRDAEIKLINGDNGNVIWEFWNNEENPNDYGWYNFYNPQIINDQNGDNYPDFLCANGGDHSLDPIETDRPPGHIMILNGVSGEILKNAVVPDSNETYMSPIFFEDKILFGTGGESIEGNLWIADFQDLLNEDLSSAISLLPNSELGIIAPPSLAKLNNDEYLDIIIQSFDGKITAIDGNTLEIIWQINIPGTESSASPIIGNFTKEDHSPDVFATLYVGAESTYNDFYQLMINGKTGNIEYMDSIGSFNFCTPISFDSNSDGKDEVLISVTNNIDDNWEHELILIDFINETNNSLYTIPGGDVWSTPYIKDIDNDNLLDLIFTTQLDNPFISSGIKTTRLETDFSFPPFGISWGSYMGTSWDGKYLGNTGCYTDLGLFAFPGVSCPEENNGMINLYVSGGAPPYSYYWSNGQITEDLENVPAGNYSVIVVDSSGCQDTISSVVTEYQSVIFSQAPSCPGGNDGWAYMSSTGCSCNSSNCQFTWSIGDSIIVQGDGSSASETYKYLFNIPAGIYTSTIVHPNGCILEEDIIVPDAPSLISDFTITLDCENSASGIIEIFPVNQDLTSCVWENQSTEFLIDNLSAGSYSVIVSDTICTDTLSFEVPLGLLDDCGVCDEILENDCIPGCMDQTACNYDLEATGNNNSCLYPIDLYGVNYLDCNGLCLNDTDGDGVCNEIDNCPETYNPNQEDINNDGIGDSCDGIGLTENESIFIIFPNPTKNSLNIISPHSEKYSLKIIDLSGKKIMEDNLLSKFNTINISNLSSGIYTIQIENKKDFYVRKLIVN